MCVKTPLIAAVMICCVLISYAATTKPFTVPEVAEWKGGEGLFVPSLHSTRIVYDSNEPRVAEIARILGQDYTTLTGRVLPVVYGRTQKGDISLKIRNNKKLGQEDYTVEITPTGVTLAATDEQGLYWATRTLLQLTERAEDGFSIPVGIITDSPEFGLRGFMLDVGRKFFPMEYLYKLVDVLSYYKMNTLHIHLNDNGFPRDYDNDWDKTQAAFRMESDRFPGLAARDGHYTKEEFRNFVNYAATREVEIIPEIDVPAHSLAFTRYMPEIASTGVNGRDHLDIANPKTYEFLDTLIAEYIGGPDPVFPGPRFHIGTDEYQGDSLAMEQFRYFTDRYIKYTEKFGKKAATWCSLTHAKGKTPVKSDDVLMYSWSKDYGNPREMLANGYRMVSIPDGYLYIVPKAGYYYDYLDNHYLYENWTPATLSGYVAKGDTVKQIEGGMFAVWNDTPSNGLTVKDVHHRVMSALPTIAAKTWSADNVTVPFETFENKSRKMIEAPGVNYLARFGDKEQTTEILFLDTVSAGDSLPIPEIGYDYTVEFDVEGRSEELGTKLFESPYATFWLSDPVSGNMGYSREGQLISFRQNVLPGDKFHVKITGNNEGTKLYVDDKLVDDMNVRWHRYYVADEEGVPLKSCGYTSSIVRTLVFPLQKAGTFNSRISNLSVVNVIR